MTRHVALLRAVNVGGTAKIAMADLRALATAIGFADTATVLQSGSLVFSANGTAASLEHRLETALDTQLCLKTEVMVRSAEAFCALVAGNPFAVMAKSDPSHLLLVVTKGALAAGALQALRAAIDGPEQIALADGGVYVTYPDGIGRSKLTMVRIEKHLGVRGTARNWSTVGKIAAALGLWDGGLVSP